MQHNLNRARGFTLIELLVVVAIIALLISILLPSLRDAREQGKVAKCLANYRQLTATSVQYFLEFNDDYPFWDGKTSHNVCSWTYGGKTCHDYWSTYASAQFYYTSADRPFNAYLMGSKLEPDLYESGKIWKRTEVPVLQCPSDRYSHQQAFYDVKGVQPFSCYDDVGTSYQYNFHVLEPLSSGSSSGGGILWNGEAKSPDVTRPTQHPTWSELGRLLVKQVLARHSSTFVMYLEDPMDFALWTSVGEIGNHGKFNRNSLGFLDGHAEYKATDTRGWCGLGWEAINPEWVQHVGQQPPRPVSYDSPFVNCNPPQ